MSNIIADTILLFVPIMFSITVHEACHGLAAYKFGDPTAKLAGRLTLNPIKHIDPVGLLVLFVTRMIGWAKPVPVDPRYFKHPRRDMMWVALAGPASNLSLAVVFALIYKFAGGYLVSSEALYPLRFMLEVAVWINVGLAVFNLIPIPPLDGGRVVAGLLPPDKANEWDKVEQYGFIIVLGLVFLGATKVVIVPIVRLIGNFLFSL